MHFSVFFHLNIQFFCFKWTSHEFVNDVRVRVHFEVTLKHPTYFWLSFHARRHFLTISEWEAEKFPCRVFFFLPMYINILWVRKTRHEKKELNSLKSNFKILSLFSQTIFRQWRKKERSQEKEKLNQQRKVRVFGTKSFSCCFFLLKIGFFDAFLFSSPSSPKFSRFSNFSLAHSASVFSRVLIRLV